METIVFIAAGGKGRRLWKDMPELKSSGLPKSIGVRINNKPMLAYQLEILLNKLKNPKIIISFSDENSCSVFDTLVEERLIPEYNYLLNTDPYHKINTSIDIINQTVPNKVVNFDFDRILLTSGDIYYDPSHLENMLNMSAENLLSILSISKFYSYMSTLDEHFQPVYKKNRLIQINKQDNIPNEILCHPQLIMRADFDHYIKMDSGTSKSEFVIDCMKKGIKFNVLESKEYVNLNFYQDYLKLKTILQPR